MASLLPYSFGQHKSGPFQIQGEGNLTSPPLDGSSGKAPLQKSTQHAIPGNNLQKEKETNYGRTGDAGK